MRIAVTYEVETGNVFQHFGHTEAFAFYDTEDDKIVEKNVFQPRGAGHGALAGVLEENKVDVLICGGIGGGAQAALESCGIELCAGASGNADEAVEAYLRGELENTGANCDHHGRHGEGHDCGHHEGGHCGHHEDGQCGCHGEGGDAGCEGSCKAEEEEAASDITGPNVGKTCRTHYRGTFDDGTQFDSSYDRGEPLEFVCGAGMMIRGFDRVVANMKVGEIVDVHLEPEDAYGQPDPNAVFTVDIADMPGSEQAEVGMRAYLQNRFGQPVPVTVTEKTETTITFDANHEMAGKALNFRIELVEVK